MIHKPIQIKNLSLSFRHKTCFDNFTTQIHYGNRIAIIGRNGSGKTSLLKLLAGRMTATSGDIQCANDTVVGFVPQIIEDFSSLSGSQRLNKAVTNALTFNPTLLLLDEPTNHLDQHNRKSLLRMLKSYPGTLVMVSHDTELLRSCINILWHIDNGQVQLFSGNYDDYIHARHSLSAAVKQKLLHLNQQTQRRHLALIKEQKRAAKSKIKGKKSINQKKWPTIVSTAKMARAEETSGRKKAAIENKKQDLNQQLANLRLPEIITPKFSLNTISMSNQTLISISNGTIGYSNQEPLLQKISLSIGAKEHIAIQGNNASGKSTLIKAILNDASIIRSGNWTMPKFSDISYLGQHYETLSAEKTVYDTIATLVPLWSSIKIRCHLNAFLFRKNEEVNAPVNGLSGGEKARLSLAQIGALTPKLLILDEITNNLDLETRRHVIEVLKNYPNAMIIISHDTDFLQEISIQTWYQIANATLFRI